MWLQVISHQKRLSYAAAHVGKGTEAFAKAGDAAAAPLKVVASGLHAGRRALDDRCVLRAAIADTQHSLQGRRERYRLHNTEVWPCHRAAADANASTMCRTSPLGARMSFFCSVTATALPDR